MTQLKGAFHGCKWCHGKGCLGCDKEREAATERAMQPMFTASLNDSDDMEQFKDVFGLDALTKAFGPDGGGMREVQQNAAVASLTQHLRKAQQHRDAVDREEIVDFVKPEGLIPEDYHS